MTIKMYQ